MLAIFPIFGKIASNPAKRKQTNSKIEFSAQDLVLADE